VVSKVDYILKDHRVLEHFDTIKIGLTPHPNPVYHPNLRVGFKMLDYRSSDVLNTPALYILL
jgi:hypothetical protein